MYIAVGGIVQNASGKYAMVYEISRDFAIEGVRQMLPLRMLGKYAIDKCLRPLNFSIDRNGAVVEDCGSFERFSPRGSVVVLRVIRGASGGDFKGAQVLDGYGGKVLKLSKDKLLSYVENYRERGEHFIQNGIYRDGVLNCYPGKPFMTLLVADKLSPSRVEAPKVDVHTGSRVGVIFTKEQKREIARARNKGLSNEELGYIENAELSPEQMHALVDGVGMGALIKYYAKPCYAVDVMVFYNGVIRSDKLAGTCAGLLSRPDLDVDVLYQLYGFVLRGLDYRGLEDMSVLDLQITLLESKSYDDDEWGPIGLMSCLEVLDSYGG